MSSVRFLPVAPLALALLFATGAGAEDKGAAPQRTAIPGVETTPTALCVPGSQRIRVLHITGGNIVTPALRYCTDATWSVRSAEHDGTYVYWTVPVTGGQVDCACTRAAKAD